MPDNGELTEEAVIEGKPAKTVKVAAKPAAAKAAGGRIAPDTMLLDAPPAERNGVREDTVKMTSRLIESKLKTYKIQAKVGCPRGTGDHAVLAGSRRRREGQHH